MYDQGGHGDYANGDNSGQHNMVREDDRKLFIGGLSWETGDADIKEYFSRFGDVESVNLKTDPNTGRSRGFAFVVFSSTDSVEAVLNAPELVIGNKKVEAKRAKARPGKVFVGGIPPEVTDDEIKSHFAAFGKIVDVETPFDKVRNQRKGFVFITFESEASMKNLLYQPKQVLGGKEVDVKRATPRGDGFMPGRGGMRGAPMGMRGGMGMMGGRGGRGFGGPPRGAPAARGGWGWGAAGGTQQSWGGGYGGGAAASSGYDAYGGGYGAGAGTGGYGGASYGYGTGGGYGGENYGYGGGAAAAGGGYGGASAAAPGGAGPGRGGAQRYQPY